MFGLGTTELLIFLVASTGVLYLVVRAVVRGPRSARKQQEEAENVMIDGKTVECPICTCSRCRASGARPATLGCGTLFLIGIVVAVFSRGGTGDMGREVRDMGREVRDLRSEVGDLKKAVKAQSSELRDRLPGIEALIKQHKDNWDLLCKHLLNLRNEAQAGRQDDTNGVSKKAAPFNGVSKKAAPFYDLIGKSGFGKGGIPKEQSEQIKQLVIELLEKLHRTIGIVNFWDNPTEVAKLRGELFDLLLFSGIHDIEKIVTEIIALAKVREKDILE